MKNWLGPARGNALFLILIAVALFAALAYAMTQTGRGGGASTREQSILAASQIMQYGGDIEQAINRLMLTNGCADTQLSFENSVVAGYTNTTPDPADNSCKLFNTAGGGMTFQKPPATVGVTDYIFTGNNRLDNVGTDVSGSGNDLLMLLFVPLEICTALDKALGLPTPDQGIENVSLVPFTGSYPGPQHGPDCGAPNNAAFVGQRAACIQYSTNCNPPYTYYFWDVVLAR